MFNLFFLLILFFSAGKIQAEPWVSTRFAQNCAACHAPGRKNLPAKDRRCTLSCQGCHVNPNGGGLRSAYGKWNEERWLRSFRTGFFAEKGTPAPYKAQPYASQDHSTIPGKSSKAASEEKLGKKHPSFGNQPSPMKTIAGADYDEEKYDRTDGLEKIISKSRQEWRAQIPDVDPFYEQQRFKIDGGADVRWQLLQGDRVTESTGEETKSKLWASFLMSADVGLRWRPWYKNFSLVYEGRYLGSPTSKKTENVAATMSRRSLYVLIDDLPYNTYVMGGYYRPLFGHYTGDHMALSQRLMSYALQGSPSIYNLTYQAITVGGSPNVPFANLHYIGKQFGSSPNDNNQGFAGVLGGRFVTLGTALSYSFWQTSRTDQVNDLEVDSVVAMHALTAGFQLWRLTTTAELLLIAKDVPYDAYYKSFAISSDNMFRVWREIYLNLQYAQTNTSVNLKPGNTSQMRLGVRGFWWAGVESMIHYNLEQNTQDALTAEEFETKTTDTTLTYQLHLYL